MTIIKIEEQLCWMCGIKQMQGIHHGIPQQLQPRNNVTIPLCNECHSKINKIDNAAVASYLYRILKTLEEKKKAIYGIKRIIEENNKNGKA